MVETAALYHHHNGLTKVNHLNCHKEICVWDECEKGCASASSRHLMSWGL